MALKFARRSTILQMLLLSHLMSNFYYTEASVSDNVSTKTGLKDHRLIVIKEETSLDSPDTRNNNTNSTILSTLIKQTILHSVNGTHPEIRNEISEKDSSLYTCANVTLKIGEYKINDNGTLHAKAYRLNLNNSFYIKNGDSVTICKPTKKGEGMSPFEKVLFTILTFVYSLITLFSAFCSLSKNSTYLKLAFVSWVCISSNIFLWIILILVIPGSQSIFSWVSMSVNMNQSVYLTSVWMSLLTCSRSLKFLQHYKLIEISKRIVTVNGRPCAMMSVCLALALAIVNFIADKVAFEDNHALIECLFCNPIVYTILFVIVFVEQYCGPCGKNDTDVSREYATYHIALCRFSVFNYACIAIGSIAVVFEDHYLLWIYTLLNFASPLLFVRCIIPRLQILLAIVSEEKVEKKLPISPKEQGKEWEL